MLGNRKVGAAALFSSTLCKEDAFLKSHSPRGDGRNYSLMFSSPASAFNTDSLVAFRANESTRLQPERGTTWVVRWRGQRADNRESPRHLHAFHNHIHFPPVLRYTSCVRYTPGPSAPSTLLSLGGHVMAAWHLGLHLISCTLKFPRS